MLVEHSGFEVDWQLPHDCRGVGPMADVASPRPSPDDLASLARFARLLAGADAAAIVACRGAILTVEVSNSEEERLPTGFVVEMHPCLGSADSGAAGLLLSGRLRWCRSSPPSGYGYAALVAAPSLAPSGRLLLVANRRSHLSEHNLRLVTAYLAQGHETKCGPALDLR
jgi:hypothetical protein